MPIQHRGQFGQTDYSIRVYHKIMRLSRDWAKVVAVQKLTKMLRFKVLTVC